MGEAKPKNFWVNDPEEIESENFTSPVEITREEAEKVVQETMSQIGVRGWCLWRLRNHKGQKICVIRDYKVQGYPEEYPAFSLAEMEMLPEDMKPSTFNLILRAKILGDAIIESVEENKVKKEAN